MWRADARRARAALALALVALAALPAGAGPDPQDALARQVAGELAVIDRARSAVGAKLGELDAARARRLAAAYRLLRAPASDRDPGDPGARMAAARRRAAVRLVLERELAERRLLAGEDAQLRRTAAAKQALAARVPEIELPTEIGRPARGRIVRRFGTARHEGSGATLAQRGVDLEVDPQSPAVAPADGVVRHAGPIRGLDAGVIIDHGAFLTVIGKLGAVSVPAGAPVRRGDRLGHAARRRVYLEVRVKLSPGGLAAGGLSPGGLSPGGLPIDPEPLLPKRNAREPR